MSNYVNEYKLIIDLQIEINNISHKILNIKLEQERLPTLYNAVYIVQLENEKTNLVEYLDNYKSFLFHN